jgi:hypothetical protein
MKHSLLAVCLVLAACSREEPPPPEPKAPAGREETRAIRNTDAVGTGGGAIADQVDGALNAQDEAERKRREAVEEQSSESPP